MDEQKKEQDSSGQQEQAAEDLEEISEHVVLQLGDDHVGCTETDELELEGKESKHVSFVMDNAEAASTSRGSSEQASDKEKLDEAKILVKEMLEAILPRSETDETPTGQEPLQGKEQRIHHILQLLDHFTRNLEAIEDHVLLAAARVESIVEQPVQCVQHSRFELYHDRPQTQPEGHERCSSRSSRTTCSSAELRLTEIYIGEKPTTSTNFAHSGTQTPTSSMVLDVTTTTTRCSGLKRPRAFSTLGAQLDQRAPCERTHHTITISANNSPSHATPAPQRRTLGARIGQTLSDFAAAICLCMQVNKDCVFCLGFFIAFVVSASFLTAFFYRTLSLTTRSVRTQQEALVTANNQVDPRLNGGYYYLYNNQRQSNLV